LTDPNLASLLADLAWLDARLRGAVVGFRAARNEVPQGGLYISDAEINRLLATSSGAFAPGIEAAPEASRPSGGRLDRLANAFAFSDFERAIVVLCLAPEIDRKYERIYAWLQDDVQATQPTVGLALGLFCAGLEEQIAARVVFDDPAGPLSCSILAPSPETGTQLARPLRLERRIVGFLLGSDDLDPALRQPIAIAHWVSPADATPVWSELRQEQLNVLATAPPGGIDWCCLLCGPAGAGKKTFAQAVCRRRGQSILIADLARAAMAGKSLDAVLASVLRETALYGVPLYLEGSPDLFAATRHAIEHWPGLLFLASSGPWRGGDPGRGPRLKIEFDVAEERLRRRIWIRHATSPEIAAQLAALYRFVPGQIEEVAQQAINTALARGDSKPSDADLLAACRSLSSRHLVAFGVKVQLRRTWDDLVLPRPVLDQLHELCAQVHFHSRVFTDWGFQAKAGLGCGLLALFSGPSGTGKTLAAEVIAGALGLDLFKIDLASLVSKYIGETEKNLARVFEDGERSGCVLFFDEADAMFGKRTEVRDAHDRYANLEINYLLQRVEDYPGVIILASNMGRNIDPAFQRRMNFVVELPFPDADHRRRIWQNVFPAAAPLEPGVDFEFLSERFGLAGGNIRNIAVAAAFHAAGNGGSINMHHLLLGLKREYQKMGKVCERAEFGDYYHLVR
jgi:SpoVK/Ycf46/Vps4 family AAA+-type ATPase